MILTSEQLDAISAIEGGVLRAVAEMLAQWGCEVLISGQRCVIGDLVRSRFG
jgi:hypothetical protein